MQPTRNGDLKRDKDKAALNFAMLALTTGLQLRA